jgi:hypothetical protein
MQEENVQADAPVEEQVAPEPQVEETPQAEEQAPSQENQEQTTDTEPVEAKVQEEVKETQPAQEEYDLTRFLQPQQEKPSFTADEDGYIDPNQFYNKVLQDAEARIEQKMQFQEAERRAWQSVENKYPEIKEDAELRDIVNAQRLADVARGGKGDLNAIAGKVLGKIQSYQTRGKAQAQVSEKVQKSAALQQTTSNNTSSDKDADRIERMSRGDENAKIDLISDWLASGKL